MVSQGLKPEGASCRQGKARSAWLLVFSPVTTAWQLSPLFSNYFYSFVSKIPTSKTAVLKHALTCKLIPREINARRVQRPSGGNRNYEGCRLIQSQLHLFNTNIYPARESIGRAFTANLGFATVPAHVLFHFSRLNKSRREGQTSRWAWDFQREWGFCLSFKKKKKRIRVWDFRSDAALNREDGQSPF